MSAAKGWFVVCVAAWTAFAVLITAWNDVTRLYEGRHPAMASDFGATMVTMYTLGLLTPVFIYVAHAFPPTRRPIVLTLAVYLTSLIAVCIVGVPLFIFVSNEFMGKDYT